MPNEEIRELKEKLHKLEQENDRSEAIVDSLNDIGYAYNSVNPAIGIDFAKQAREIAEAIGYDRGVGRSYNAQGTAEITKGDYPEAIDSIKKCSQIYERLGFRTGIASIYNNLGIIYRKLGIYDKALMYCLDAIAIHKEMDNKIGFSSAFVNTGNIYKEMFEYDKALDYYNKALVVLEDIGNLKFVTNALGNIGNIYLELCDYDKAKEYFNKALELRLKINDPFGIALSYQEFGYLYSELGDYSKSLKLLLKSKGFSEKVGNKNQLSGLFIMIGRAYIKLGKYPEALKNLQKGLDLAEETGSLRSKADGCQYLAELYEVQNDYENCYHYYKLYHDLENEIIGESTTKRITQIELAREIETKEKETEIHRLKNIELEREIKQRKQTEKALKKSEERFRKLSIEDPLTGIFNRRYLFDQGFNIVNRAVRDKRDVCFGMLDIDNFKETNDKYGHQAGDYILWEFARIVSKCIRPNDLLARYGGEEFVVLFQNSGLREATQILTRIQEMVEGYIFVYNGIEIRTTVSGGVAHFDEIDSSVNIMEEMIKLADKRMYLAKQSGRNTIVYQGL